MAITINYTIVADTEHFPDATEEEIDNYADALERTIADAYPEHLPRIYIRPSGEVRVLVEDDQRDPDERVDTDFIAGYVEYLARTLYGTPSRWRL